MKQTSSATQQAPAVRAGIRRTAWILAACAVASYAIFLFSAMGGK